MTEGPLQVKEVGTAKPGPVSPWSYFLPALLISVAGIAVSLITPDSFRNLMLGVRDQILTRAGWCYIWLDGIFLVAMLVLGLGPWGRIKLGKPEDRPEFSGLVWFGLLFCAALAAGLVFFGVAEPLSHFANPPAFAGVAPRTEASAQWSLVTSFFHWGFNAWCIYLVIPIPLAYLVHKRGFPCRISSVLHPLLGNTVHGWTGKAVDGLCTLVSVSGIALSLGYVGLQLAGGIHYEYGINLGLPGTVCLILLLTVCMTASSVSGLDRSIKMLSNLNVALALFLMIFVFVVGPTLPALRMTVSALKEYVTTLPWLAFRTVDGEGASWMNQWTVMYYAWWFSWAPMVGVFYVRVSKGRTIRELIVAGLIAPVLVDVLWFGVFGGSSLILDLYNKAGLANVMIEHGMEYPVFALLHQLPLPAVTVPLFLLLIAIFFVAGGDATAMSIAILSSGGDQDPANWMRVTWGALQGVTAAALILMGGIGSMEAASIVAGFFMVFLLSAALIATIVLVFRDRVARPAEPASVGAASEGSTKCR
ncbi:MAG: BCCT family transporter [Acidobacteria bacterium]|nr:BCCT family transporter [Acidobacteriota bacterium]